MDVVYFVAVLTIASCGGAYAITRLVPMATRIALRPVMQPTLTVLGVQFALLLGFFITQSATDFTADKVNVNREAISLGTVFRLARNLDDTDRRKIRGLCRRYADVLMDEEWPLLAFSKYSPNTTSTMMQLSDAVFAVNPNSLRQQIILPKLIDATDELTAARRMRLGTNSEGLPLTSWLIIGFGATSILWATFLLAPENKMLHLLQLVCLLVPITLNAHLLSEFAHPYAGVFQIEPKMLRFLKENIFIQSDDAPRFSKDGHGAITD
jgi:hypothetical protein